MIHPSCAFDGIPGWTYWATPCFETARDHGKYLAWCVPTKDYVEGASLSTFDDSGHFSAFGETPEEAVKRAVERACESGRLPSILLT